MYQNLYIEIIAEYPFKLKQKIVLRFQAAENNK